MEQLAAPWGVAGGDGKVFLEAMLSEQYLEIGRGLCQGGKTRKGFWAEGTVGANTQSKASKCVQCWLDGSPYWNVGYRLASHMQITRLESRQGQVEQGLRSCSKGKGLGQGSDVTTMCGG